MSKPLLIIAFSVNLLFARDSMASENKPPLQFEYTVSQIQKSCDDAIAMADRAINAIASLKDNQITFENTFLALDKLSGDLQLGTNVPLFLKYVSPREDVRKTAHENEVKLEQYFIQVFGREDLYRPIALFAKSPQAQKLDEVDRRLLEKTMLDFKFNGLELPKEKRTKLLQLKKELSQLEADFSRNVLEYSDFLEVTKEELAGLPENYVSRLEKTTAGNFKVTLNYPDYFPFMENATSADARRRLEEKFANRAGAQNVKLLESALKIRKEIAELLGFENHAQAVLEDRMAKTPEEVRKFLARLRAKLIVKGQAEIATLLEIKQKDDPTAEQIDSWDWMYYDNLLKKTQYSVDDQLIKTYFPLDVVMNGMLDIYQTILDLTFREMVPSHAWHESIRLFEVRNRSDQTLVGYFYLDLYPRDGKYGHAAAFTLRKGRAIGTTEDGYDRPVAALVTNFAPPSEQTPSLLTHGEVETLFHEFGHIMHQVLTRARHSRFSGTSVLRDFVEAPSQMLENWVWDSAILEKISGHYQDRKKKLPENLRKKLVAAKNVNVGLRYLRQIFFATVDMEYHTRPVPMDSTAIWVELQKDITLINPIPGTHRQASFTHFMGGYDAGYYGYLWSEVFAADMFTRFEKQGLLNTKVGRDYRSFILSPGGSREPKELLIKFLGREPNEKAFLKSLGLQP